MKTIDICFYPGENSCAIQSPAKNAGEAYTPMYRLITDEGKALTKDNGETTYNVIDIQVNDKDNWVEIDDPIK